MTGHESHSTDDTIAEKTDRLETIIAELEDGDVSLERAQQLHEEGQNILDALSEELDIGEADIVERS